MYKLTLLDIPSFLGHLHPLVVHLPIGFILLAMIFDLLGYHQKYGYLKNAVPITLLASFAAAIASCIFGYILSLSGEYDAETLTNHKYGGIVLTIICGCLFLATTGKGKSIIRIPSKIFSVFFIALTVLMAYTGHQGGSLTHGNAYLTLEILRQERRPKPVNAEAAMIFEDVVHPMLESRCSQCHQAGRLKGKLSIKTLASLLKGGKHGAAVTPGKPLESELFKRIILDPDNEDFMPAEGKTPLTKNEVEIIRWWIEKANAAEGKSIASLKGKEVILPRVALYLGLSKGVPAESDVMVAQNINPDIPLAADTAVIEKLRSNGVRIRYMQRRPVMLDVTLAAQSPKKIAAIKTDLQMVAKNIIWLNLSDNNLTDGDLDFLAKLTNMEKLRIEKNPISDAVAKHLVKLPHLESLNMNETSLTDNGLAQLQTNSSIKNIYRWHTSCRQ